jgi:hypothetical protein
VKEILEKLVLPAPARLLIYAAALVAGVYRLSRQERVLEGWVGVLVAVAALLALVTVVYRTLYGPDARPPGDA